MAGQIKDEAEIRDILIQTTDGKTVRLGDIARVERTYAEPQRNGFFVSGKPALAICLAMEEDAIVPDVGWRQRRYSSSPTRWMKPSTPSCGIWWSP